MPAETDHERAERYLREAAATSLPRSGRCATRPAAPWTAPATP